MTAVDTSTWVAYLQGDNGRDVRLLDTALGDKLVVIPPVVLTELLSDATPGLAMRSSHRAASIMTWPC